MTWRQTDGRIARWAAGAVDGLTFTVAALAGMVIWLTVLALIAPGYLPGWVTLAEEGTDAVLALAAGGWLVRRVGSLAVAALTHDPRGWRDLRASVVPMLLAVAVVVLGAGWAG